MLLIQDLLMKPVWNSHTLEPYRTDKLQVIVIVVLIQLLLQRLSFLIDVQGK